MKMKPNFTWWLRYLTGCCYATDESPLRSSEFLHCGRRDTNKRMGGVFLGGSLNFELFDRGFFERCLKRAFQPGEKIYEVIVL
jgi:hypothetical protein